MTRDSRLKREAPRREAGSARKGESGGARSAIAITQHDLDTIEEPITGNPEPQSWPLIIGAWLAGLVLITALWSGNLW